MTGAYCEDQVQLDLFDDFIEDAQPEIVYETSYIGNRPKLQHKRCFHSDLSKNQFFHFDLSKF